MDALFLVEIKVHLVEFTHQDFLHGCRIDGHVWRAIHPLQNQLKKDSKQQVARVNSDVFSKSGLDRCFPAAQRRVVNHIIVHQGCHMQNLKRCCNLSEPLGVSVLVLSKISK
ncbi:Uncharacterised protein [Chlamydia trachomatis]|nr:Uncharacterised protein [Chlamydia trachomatis]